MISFLVNFLILLFTYLLVCLISFCLILFASKGIGRFVRKFKFAPVKNSSLATIVYVTESIKKEDVSSLLEILNKQEYDKSYYELHFILDGCNDETANMLEFIGGSKVYRMGSLGMPCGKEESISAVIERVLVSSNPDAFVFLNGNRKISEKFLSSVNVALAKNSVVVGMTQLEPKENCCAYHKILNCANLYSNRIINFGRSVLGLSCIIDFDICALKTTALEKVQCIECENESSELNYTFLLAQKKLAPVFNPCVISTISFEHYKEKNYPLKTKLSLFLKNFPMIFKTPSKKFFELVFSMLKPNFCVLASIYIIIFAFSYTFEFFYDIDFVASVGSIAAMSFLISLMVAKLNLQESFHLCLKPFLPLLKHFKSFKTETSKYNLSKKGYSKDLFFEKKIVNVYVTDGRVNLECRLELFNHNGFYRVVFKFKKKKYVTSEFETLSEAIQSISNKLLTYGFKLKICKNCLYFAPSNDLTGICSCPSAKVSERLLDDKKTIWQDCKFYVYNEQNNLIKLSEFKSSK